MTKNLLPQSYKSNESQNRQDQWSVLYDFLLLPNDIEQKLQTLMNVLHI